jgi:16S rRNA (cytidine1402-2'-O)-methyltransferase
VATLLVVATPIGNMEDITLRALRVLREVTLIAAEDTRTTRALLTHHGIRTRLLSYNEHNMRGRTPQLLAALETGDIALVSEAGTPGVSDPGHELVVAALAASGLPMRQFTFLGFLPRRPGERRRVLGAVAREPRTLVLFEARHRLRRTLEDIHSTLGERRIAVCREMTKAFEEIFLGTVSEALQQFAEPRGEFTLVLEGAAEQVREVSDDAIIEALTGPAARPLSTRDAAAGVAAELKVPRRRVYALAVSLRKPTRPRRRAPPPAGR